MKKYICSIVFCLIYLYAQSQPEFTIFLLGDAGNWDSMPTLFKTLQKDLEATPNSGLMILGDNVYPKGILKGSKDFEVEKTRLQNQLEICKNYKGYVFVVPGNHDWRAGKRNGLQAIQDQAEWVNEYLLYNTQIANKRNAFTPEYGLPGPDFIDINYNFRMIFIDTHWWLQHQNLKKVGLLANKNYRETSTAAFKKLDSLILDAKLKNMNVVLASHHPMVSSGIHKHSPIWIGLLRYTPLKIFGLMGLDRLMVQSSNHPRQKKLFRKIKTITDQYQNITFVAGHEHAIFVKDDKKNLHVIAGAGSKHSRSDDAPVEEDYFNKNEYAYVKIQLDRYGNKTIKVINESGQILYTYEVKK